VERPQWDAIRGVIDDLQRTMEKAAEFRREAMEVTGTAWSDDRLVKAVVGPRGQLIELEIDPRVYRTPNSKALAASILATVKAAVEDANKKSRDIMERAMPKDRGLGLLGKTDFDVMLENHDADLPKALKKKDEQEGGHGYIS
jgi:DNA-binding protein YbaB